MLISSGVRYGWNAARPDHKSALMIKPTSAPSVALRTTRWRTRRAAAGGRECFTWWHFGPGALRTCELYSPHTGSAREDQIRRDRSDTAKSGTRDDVTGADMPPRTRIVVLGV